jgi:hypothetical protein
MPNILRFRIHRAGACYDIPKETVRRVCACYSVISIGSHGAYSAELEGLPALIIEPTVFQSPIAQCDIAPHGDPVAPPKLAVLVGDSADMPIALAADDIDAMPEPSLQAIAVSADTIHTVLLHPLEKTLA